MSIAGWMRSQLQRSVDDAARRMHARLVEAGFGPVQPPRMTAPLVFAVGVLAVIAAAVVGMVWATAHATGVVAWVLVVIGWLVLAALLIPRPVPLPDDVTVLDRSTTPHLHQVVAHLAAAVGTPTPERIGVDTSFNAYVGRFGWRGKDTLVLGLPFWAASTWDERLGVMGHELGHLAGRDTAQGRLKYATSSILRRTVSMMLDAGPVDPLREVLRSPSEDLTVSFEGRVTRAVLRVLAIPPSSPCSPSSDSPPTTGSTANTSRTAAQRWPLVRQDWPPRCRSTSSGYTPLPLQRSAGARTPLPCSPSERSDASRTPPRSSPRRSRHIGGMPPTRRPSCGLTC